MGAIRERSQVSVGATRVDAPPLRANTGGTMTNIVGELAKVQGDVGGWYEVASFEKPESAANYLSKLRERHGHAVEAQGWEFRAGQSASNPSFTGLYACYTPEKVNAEVAARKEQERQDRRARAAENRLANKAAKAAA